MSRNRFLSLLAFFHLANNDDMLPKDSPGYDKLFKVRKLFDHINRRCFEVYYPEKELAVDESIMPWKGRVAWRQFIPSKPVRYGMKLYCCCESNSGYICYMKMYTGKEGERVEIGHGPNVVKEVTSQFMDRGHTIYMDSFFTNYQLMRELQENNTTACGTVRKNRIGNPPDLSDKNTKLVKGDHAVRQKGDIIALRFNDRKDVMFLSTVHTGWVVDTGKRKRGEETTQKKPEIVHQYNCHMNGVDTLDQHLSYYSFNRKVMKWWKRAATHLLHMAKVQAFILYNKCTEGTMSQRDFTLQLVRQLTNSASPQAEMDPLPVDPVAPAPVDAPVGDALPQAKRRTIIMPMDFERLDAIGNQHHLEYNPPTAKKQKPSLQCKCCGDKESRFRCRKCKVPLCAIPCMEIFHSQVDYKRALRRLASE